MRCENGCLLARQAGLASLCFTTFFIRFFRGLTIAWAKRSQRNYQTDLHQIWYLFRDRSRDVAMATNFRRQIGRHRRHAFLLGLVFHNGWQYGNADGRINTPDVLSTSRKNLVNFGLLIPEFTALIWQPFRRQTDEIEKIAISQQPFDQLQGNLTR